MDLGLSEELEEVSEKIRTFITEKVDPVEGEYQDEINVGDRWSHTPRQDEILNGLKEEARKLGLWNFFLPKSQGGAGISNLEYAHLAEIMGRSRLASESFNCSAPDTGNMEVLERYGSEEQKKQWLEPLLAGEIRSAFAMTEPAVASSDATNIATTAILEGDEWVISGEKFYISGAGDARCKIMICMVVTSPDAPRLVQQSQILVPLDTPGLEILGAMHVFGHDGAPHGHMHIKLTDRSERIRTYNFPQGRLTDHRINLTLYKLEEILGGALDYVAEPLMHEFQAEQLAKLADDTEGL